MLFVLFFNHTLCRTLFDRLYQAHQEKKAVKFTNELREPRAPKDMFPYFDLKWGLKMLKKKSEALKNESKVNGDQRFYDSGEKIYQDYQAAYRATISVFLDNTKIMLYAMQMQNPSRSKSILNMLTTRRSYNQLLNEDIIEKLARTKMSALANTQKIVLLLDDYQDYLGQKSIRLFPILESYQEGHHNFIDSFIKNPNTHFVRFKVIFEDTKIRYSSFKTFSEFESVPETEKREINKNIEEIGSSIDKAEKKK